MPNYHVIVHGTDREALADLGRAHHVYVYRQTLFDDGPGYRVSALADEQTIQRLQRAGYHVEQHDDVHHVAQHLRHGVSLPYSSRTATTEDHDRRPLARDAAGHRPG